MRSTPRAVSDSGRSHSTCDLRGERREHVRLVQVVRRRDDHRVELVELEQVLDVGEDVGNVEAVGERARLRRVVVA